MAPKQQFKVLLVGNPNCGKTTIFNSCRNESQSRKLLELR
ncbi:MAG: GTPase [Bacilli bacterium]